MVSFVNSPNQYILFNQVKRLIKNKTNKQKKTQARLGQACSKQQQLQQWITQQQQQQQSHTVVRKQVHLPIKLFFNL